MALSITTPLYVSEVWQSCLLAGSAWYWEPEAVYPTFIERLNATFRQCLAVLTRKGRMLARLPQTLTAGMYLVGTVYNFCAYHDSLAVELLIAPNRRRWLRRTPAIAAGLTNHRWSVQELLTFKVPPPPYVPPKRRGRPPKRAIPL